VRNRPRKGFEERSSATAAEFATASDAADAVAPTRKLRLLCFSLVFIIFLILAPARFEPPGVCDYSNRT
jgi:hypothetical protein